MELGQQAKNYILEASKWATFLSIIGFIAIGLMIILSFTIGTVLANLPVETMGGISPQFFSFFYLIIAGVYFIPVFYLFQFGSKTKQAIINNDTDVLTFGLKKLRSHYKFLGIISIIGISFYIILMIFGVFSALMV